MSIDEKFLTVRGVKIHVLCAGEAGPAVMLLHGGGIDSARLSWGPFIQPLAGRGLRVFAPEMPGYGDSDRPARLYTIEDYVGIVDELLDSLGLDRVSLVGLSMGGAIALGSALRWPERVERLVLVGSYGLQRRITAHWLSWLTVKTPGLLEATNWTFRSSRRLTEAMLPYLFHNPKAVPAEIVDELFADYQRPHAGRAFTYLQRYDVTPTGLRTVYLDRLGEVRARTLLVHGDHDAGVPLAWAEEAARRIPGARLHVIRDAGHWAQREHPAEFERVVGAFLTEAQ